MWIWIIIIAVVIGAILGYLGSDGKDSGSNAAQGAMAGGCMAGGCIMHVSATSGASTL